jgi:hypothetical protein
MTTIATTTAPESREQALTRLATQARASGVKLYQDRNDGRFYGSSRSQPGTLHRLTGFSCTCPGFVRHSRCAHLAALHSALGWINVDPEPEPPVMSGICSDEDTQFKRVESCGHSAGGGAIRHPPSCEEEQTTQGSRRLRTCSGTGRTAADMTPGWRRRR